MLGCHWQDRLPSQNNFIENHFKEDLGDHIGSSASGEAGEAYNTLIQYPAAAELADSD